MLVRLELSISTCSEILHHIRNQAGLVECEYQLQNLSKGDQVQQDREGLRHSKIDLVWVSQTGGKHLVVCFKHNFKYLDKCLSTST